MFSYFSNGIKAGVIAGFLLGLLNIITISPLILEAEKYELPETPVSSTVGHDHEHHDEHHHEQQEEFSPEGKLRSVLTVVGDTILGCVYGILLSALVLVAIRFNLLKENFYERHYWEGLIIGLGFFSIIHGIPSIGLTPVPPGIIGGGNDLIARQKWWIISALFSFIGFCFVWFRGKVFSFVMPGKEKKSKMFFIAGLLAFTIIASIPFVIGVPPHSEKTTAPLSIQHAFIWKSLSVNFIFWLVLGTFFVALVKKEFNSQPAVHKVG